MADIVTVQQAGFAFIDAIHPDASVSPSSKIGSGVAVMAGAIINADVHIADNVIINTGAIVEHDCRIADHVHISTGAKLAGGVTVERGVHVGIGASVRESITIGAHAVVGAGAVVVKDVPPGQVVAGVPARMLHGVRANIKETVWTGPGSTSIRSSPFLSQSPTSPRTPRP